MLTDLDNSDNCSNVFAAGWPESTQMVNEYVNLYSAQLEKTSRALAAK